jgi:hypothetical protein
MQLHRDIGKLFQGSDFEWRMIRQGVRIAESRLEDGSSFGDQPSPEIAQKLFSSIRRPYR